MSAGTSESRIHSRTVPEVAAAAGADDLFVLRRVGEGRFAHVGGVGRGAGWAGIVEFAVEEETFFAEAFGQVLVLRRSRLQPWQVFGPYYACGVAIVALDNDVVIVFGSAAGTLEGPTDEELVELATSAAHMLVEVAPAKRLADELEALNALRDLLSAPAETYVDALQNVVDRAASALSCELGILYIPGQGRIAVADQRGGTPLAPLELLSALEEIHERKPFPLCIQDALTNDLPAPLASRNGTLAYYLLEIDLPTPGFLLLLHTAARPARGFTNLCQSLGTRLVEAAEPYLVSALSRDRLREQLESSELQARRDSLTGLANRLGWDEAVEQARPCPDAPASIVQLDCRGLKAVNDTHGHHVGDELLCRVAAVLLESTREQDLVARLGGDEFGLLLCGADELHASEVVRRVERRIAEERLAGVESIELAVGSSTTRDGDLLAAQRTADAQMLSAKRQSRSPGSSST